MKLTFRILNNNIVNELIDKGWSSRWAEDFVHKKDSQLLLKVAFKCLSNKHKTSDIKKFIKTFKLKKRRK